MPAARDSQAPSALCDRAEPLLRPGRDSGVLERLPDAPRTPGRAQAWRDAQPTAAATGSRSARTTETGGPSGCDAGRKARGRKRHLAVDVEGFPVALRVHEADVQDRDGAPAVILAMLEKAPEVTKPWADGGYAGPKLEAALAEHGLGPVIEIVQRPRETRGFTVPCRRWVVERTFARMSRCRRPGRRTPGGRWRARWPGRGSRRAGS